MKVSTKLKNWLKENGFEYSVESTEHPGCWGKSCEGQHLIEEIKVWRKGRPKYKHSFAGGYPDYFIQETLETELLP